MYKKFRDFQHFANLLKNLLKKLKLFGFFDYFCAVNITCMIII
jgi:hypothetical protein